ncbi:hypothetical protein ACN20G_03195 [Streptomyces sp. BI20]|uniref:hypothetical protein n=1 Tax=Streptomyces sp. BI20 TaxID=3403460 RepID=UPI003C75FC0A
MTEAPGERAGAVGEPAGATGGVTGDACGTTRTRGDACPGALRLHPADDGALARIRVPGGLIDPAAGRALADAAEQLGDGGLDLTSRGNVQLRGLSADAGAELGELLDAVGLLPAPGHERVRNVLLSPLSGLDTTDRPDVTPWVRELDAELCARDWTTGLSGRFLFACDDGRGDVAALDPDVTLSPDPADPARALVRIAGADLAAAVPFDAAPRAALTAARLFLDAARAAGTRAWQIRELPSDHALSGAGLVTALRAGGIPATPAPVPAPAPAPAGVAADGEAGGEAGGPGPRPGRHGAALVVLAPFARVRAEAWRLLVDLAGPTGPRTTPWRGFVLPQAPPGAEQALAEAGLITEARDPRARISACVGRPGCAKAHADVRAEALALADTADGPLPVHWSGCDRRCGHPRGTAWVDVIAGPDGTRLVTRPGADPVHAPGPVPAATLAALRTVTGR